MSREKILIKQPFGLGDILFVSPIVRQLDYDIVWPVESHYLWISKYIKANNIQFVDANNYNFNQSEIEILNLLDAQPILTKMGYNIDCMSAKYVYADHDLADWKNLHWERDYSKEKSLMDFLGIQEGEPYNLVNLNFADPKLGYKIKIPIANHVKNIYMDYYDGYTLLDWGMVIENSKEFHTVSTATFYMVEFLGGNPQLHLYPRHGLESNLEPIRPIISERWICHE